MAFYCYSKQRILKHINDKSKELMAQSEISWIKNMGSNPKVNLIYDAPTLIIVSGNKKCTFP